MITGAQLAWLRALPVGGQIRNRLKIAMVLLGVDGQTIAAKTGLREQYISAVAVGRFKDISYKNACLIGQALGLAPSDVFPFGEDAAGREDRGMDYSPAADRMLSAMHAG